MDSNLDKNNQDTNIAQNIEDICEQDWPLLKELEKTRFSLKKKRGQLSAPSSMANMKETTDQEDQMISEQSVQDEKVIDTFLGTRNVKQVEEVVSSNLEVAKNPVTQAKELGDPSEYVIDRVQSMQPTIGDDSGSNSFEKAVNHETVPQESSAVIKAKEVVEITVKKEVVPEPVQTVQPVKQEVIAAPVKQEIVQQKAEIKKNIPEEMPKLIAIGMAKVYINKTDSMLNPLRFIMNNSALLMIAILQFVVPAIITWILINDIPFIATQFSKESVAIRIIYSGIFYFACLFLWITGQVLIAGFVNIVKQSMTNLVKEGKN